MIFFLNINDNNKKRLKLLIIILVIKSHHYNKMYNNIWIVHVILVLGFNGFIIIDQTIIKLNYNLWQWLYYYFDDMYLNLLKLLVEDNLVWYP